MLWNPLAPCKIDELVNHAVNPLSPSENIVCACVWPSLPCADIVQQHIVVCLRCHRSIPTEAEEEDELNEAQLALQER